MWSKAAIAAACASRASTASCSCTRPIPPRRPCRSSFGPDSYRFAGFIRAELTDRPIAGPILDIGTGSGVGGIVATRLAGIQRVVLTDINPAALDLARANAAHAGVVVEGVLAGDVLQIDGQFAVIVANPPFIDDPDQLAYRHGGGRHGAQA